MLDVWVPCGACGKPVRGGDEFCEACGAQVGDELKQALRDRLEASHADYFQHSKQARSARTTIAVLSVLFVLGGVVMFFVTRSQATEALRMLPVANDSALLETPSPARRRSVSSGSHSNANPGKCSA